MYEAGLFLLFLLPLISRYITLLNQNCELQALNFSTPAEKKQLGLIGERRTLESKENIYLKIISQLLVIKAK